MNNLDGTVRFFLGYTNLNPFPVTIQRGLNTELNKNVMMINDDNVLLQPEVFQPGQFKGVFNVQTSGTSIVKWLLQHEGNMPSFVLSSDGVAECQPLIPTAECVEFISPTSKVAALGYDNKNDFPLTIEIGNYNQIIPAPIDRGQPTTFQPGKFVNVFNTNFNNQIDWVLGPLTATATDDTPACSPSGDCVDTDIRDRQFQIDTDTRSLMQIVESLAKTLTNAGNAKDRQRAIELRKQARELYQQSWTFVWSLPGIIVTCTDDIICARVDNSAVISSLNTNTDTLFAMVKSTARRVTRLLGQRRPRESRLLNRARAINQSNMQLINSIPRIASDCG